MAPAPTTAKSSSHPVLHQSPGAGNCWTEASGVTLPSSAKSSYPKRIVNVQKVPYRPKSGSNRIALPNRATKYDCWVRLTRRGKIQIGMSRHPIIGDGRTGDALKKIGPFVHGTRSRQTILYRSYRACTGYLLVVSRKQWLVCRILLCRTTVTCRARVSNFTRRPQQP